MCEIFKVFVCLFVLYVPASAQTERFSTIGFTLFHQFVKLRFLNCVLERDIQCLLWHLLMDQQTKCKARYSTEFRFLAHCPRAPSVLSKSPLASQRLNPSLLLFFMKPLHPNFTHLPKAIMMWINPLCLTACYMTMYTGVEGYILTGSVHREVLTRGRPIRSLRHAVVNSVVAAR